MMHTLAVGMNGRKKILGMHSQMECTESITCKHGIDFKT